MSPLCPKFNSQEYLDQVAKHGKVKTSEQKEVLQWRQKNMKACALCLSKAA